MPPIKVMQKLATSAGYGGWHDARHVIEEVAEALSQFTYLAQQQGISNKESATRDQQNDSVCDY